MAASTDQDHVFARSGSLAATVSLGDPKQLAARLDVALGERCEIEPADDGSIIVTLPDNGIEMEVWAAAEPARVELELFVAVTLIRIGLLRDMGVVERRCRELVEKIHREHWEPHGWALAATHVWDKAASTETAHDDLLLYEVSISKPVASVEDVIEAIAHAEHAEHFVELKD